MMKSSILSLITFFSFHASATAPVDMQVLDVAKAMAQPVDTLDLIDWTVGDTADFKVSGGIINGKMHSQVREKVADGLWIQQDMDLGFMGSQKVEVLYDTKTGQVLQLLVNGQKQTPPDASDMEVIDSRRETVTVPKGTFDCIYAKVHSKKENQNSEVWINPELVSLGGMIKTLAPSQLGTITIELTDFRKQ